MINTKYNRFMKYSVSVGSFRIQGIFVVMLLVLFSCKDSSEANQAPSNALPVKVSIPLTKNIQIKKDFTGRFVPVNQVDVRARVGGFLTSAKFTEGEFVEKGTVLFTIDRRPFQIALDENLSNLERQKTLAQENESNFSRVQDLRASGAISAEEYERRKLANQSSKSGIQSAEALVEQARLNLSFATVRAPISGRVGRKMVTEGNLVSGGNENATLLTTVVQTKPIHFYMSASESDFFDIAGQDENRNGIIGDSLSIFLRQDTKNVFVGAIDFLGNQIDNGTGTIDIRAKVPNENGRIEPGMFGEAIIYGNPIPDALLVPDVVIGSNQNIKYVYTLNAENQTQMTPVVIGELYENDMRLIKSGLNPDDRVVLNNIQKIRPGMQVEPIPSNLNEQPLTSKNTAQ